MGLLYLLTGNKFENNILHSFTVPKKRHIKRVAYERHNKLTMRK